MATTLGDIALPFDAARLPAGAPSDRVRLSTLLAIRWITIGGQAATLLFVYVVLGLDLPFATCAVVLLVAVVANVWLHVHGRGRPLITEREATGWLAVDLLQLSTLLFFTGGLENPFIIMVVGPITVAANVLSRVATAILTVLAIVLVGVLTIWHAPPPLNAGTAPGGLLYTVGFWVALTVTCAFVAAYTWYVAQDARRLQTALAATEAALAREQRLASLGALAAAVAHDLGTPLATIAVTAKEVARCLPQDHEAAEDMALLLSQTERCRDILTRLIREPQLETAGAAGFIRPTLGALAEEAAAPYQDDPVPVLFDRAPEGPDAGPEPTLPQAPEVRRALGLLIQNATQFAASRVEVSVQWSLRRMSVSIQDDGPGFLPAVLARLGEPYISMRDNPDGHLGLGIFIAETLLRRTGAELFFSNVARDDDRIGSAFVRPVGGPRPNSGARVVITWPRRLTSYPDERSES